MENYSQNRLVYGKKLHMHRLNNCITSISTNGNSIDILLLGTKAFTKKELKTIIKELVEGYGYWGRFDKYGCSSLAEEQDDYIKKIIQNAF